MLSLCRKQNIHELNIGKIVNAQHDTRAYLKFVVFLCTVLSFVAILGFNCYTLPNTNEFKIYKLQSMC